MKRTLKPFEGLGAIEFGMTEKQVQSIVNVKDREVTNKFLRESKLVDNKTAYVFQDGILMFIEMDYQEEVYLNGIDIFSVKDVQELLKGCKIESKRDTAQVKELGLILSDFKSRDVTKRYLIFYSKEISPDFEHYLDIV